MACKHCGRAIIEEGKRRGPKRRYCSDQCRNKGANRNRDTALRHQVERNAEYRFRSLKFCEQCGVTFHNGRWCSDRCHQRFRSALRLAARKTRPRTECLECGETIVGGWGSSRPKTRFCSRYCRDRFNRRNRRAQIIGRLVDRVSLATIIRRDGRLCHICDLPVSLTAKRPNIISPTLDHVIPLARGGEHSAANLKLAHWSCNSRKGAR